MQFKPQRHWMVKVPGVIIQKTIHEAIAGRSTKGNVNLNYLWGLFQNVFQVFRLGAGNVFQVSRSDALFMFILDLFNDASKGF